MSDNTCIQVSANAEWAESSLGPQKANVPYWAITTEGKDTTVALVARLENHKAAARITKSCFRTYPSLIIMDATSITAPLDKIAALEFVRTTLGGDIEQDDIESVLGPYLKYYNDEIIQLQFGPEEERQTAELAVGSHGDLARIIDILKINGSKTRPELRGLLRDLIFPSAGIAQINRSIDVALRLWLMINVRESKFDTSSQSHRPSVQWNDGSKLRDFLHSLFPNPRWELTAREGRHDPKFTVAFMATVCGLQVRWTTTLEDHLRFDRIKRTLWVFPYKTYLQLLVQRQAANKQLTMFGESLIPANILDETINSLLLLFPEPDKSTQSLLRAHRQGFNAHEPYEPSRPLGILDFDRWRDRLLELYQEVYQVQSPSWYQLLRDQRNPQQWMAFWLGLIIACLTLVSAVTGTIAMVASVEQIWGPRNPQLCICGHGDANSSTVLSRHHGYDARRSVANMTP